MTTPLSANDRADRRPDGDDRVLEVDDLEVAFPLRSGWLNRTTGHVRAVDGVSFDLDRGETLGLVGESGSGKTTIGRSILRAIDPTGGRVRFTYDDTTVDLTTRSGAELRAIRPHLQMIFQDPYTSLNPRMTVQDIIAEPLVINRLASGRELERRVREMADRCRIDPAHLRRYPHAFSGGQRQRIGIARALVTDPAFVVADEAVSALDVSIQADILNLLADLQAETGVAFLFIAHDLSVVAALSHRVAVLYLGQLMELASTAELFARPRHPYTEALLSAIPQVGRRTMDGLIKLDGETPGLSDVPSGCRFHTRCRYAVDRCRTEQPDWAEVEPGRLVRCHLAGDLELQGAAGLGEAQVSVEPRGRVETTADGPSSSTPSSTESSDEGGSMPGEATGTT